MHGCLNSTIVGFNNLVIGVQRYVEISDDFDPFKTKFEISKDAAYFYIHPRQVKAAYEKILDKVRRKRKVKIDKGSVYKKEEGKKKRTKVKIMKIPVGPKDEPKNYKPILKKQTENQVDRPKKLDPQNFTKPP